MHLLAPPCPCPVLIVGVAPPSNEGPRNNLRSKTLFPAETQNPKWSSAPSTRVLLSPCKPLFSSSRPSPLSSRLSPFVYVIFVGICVFLRLILSVLPHDLPTRWDSLYAVAQNAETIHLPTHLLQAVVACEDRRFFQHSGLDPVGICRAIFSLSSAGGGSTITQQLVKNVFLTNERKFSRKLVEMILALILERKMSKWKILCAYLCTIYWGHGIYGIESASAFYFSKHPSSLCLGESAMLAGIIPSPERLSPFREPSRGKRSQARCLRRMIKAGYVDVEMASMVLKQSLYLCET